MHCGNRSSGEVKLYMNCNLCSTNAINLQFFLSHSQSKEVNSASLPPFRSRFCVNVLVPFCKQHFLYNIVLFDFNFSIVTMITSYTTCFALSSALNFVSRCTLICLMWNHLDHGCAEKCPETFTTACPKQAVKTLVPSIYKKLPEKFLLFKITNKNVTKTNNVRDKIYSLQK